MRPLASLMAALVLAALGAAPAAAAPPPNDAPAGAVPFSPYPGSAGSPGETQAVAELAEATPEPALAPCLGAGTFARTVWFRIPASGGARELSIEASGRTIAPADLAAFVQPGPAGEPVTLRANACAGADVGGADAAEERGSALTLRVPPGRAVLVQVGRRGPAGSADDERYALTLAEVAVPPTAPKGDRAGLATPRVPRSGTTTVGLSGATTTEEDTATPACPSQGSVWRRIRPPRTGAYTVVATGAHVGTLTVFRGALPGPDTVVDCVDREGPGALSVSVRARRGQRLWVRLGTDRPPVGARSKLFVLRGRRPAPRDGGGCLGTGRSSIAGALAGGPPVAKRLNRRRFVTLALRIRRGPVCAARMQLVGPGGRLFAVAEVAAVRGPTQLVQLRRLRRLVRGRYRLQVEAAGLARVRGLVPSSVSFTLR